MVRKYEQPNNDNVVRIFVRRWEKHYWESSLTNTLFGSSFARTEAGVLRKARILLKKYKQAEQYKVYYLDEEYE